MAKKILLGTQANSDTLSLYESGWHDTATTVIDNTWHHIACVLEDSSDTITIYVNGSEVSRFASTASIAASDVFSLGQEYDAGMAASNFYNGLLDDVRVYSRALTGQELQSVKSQKQYPGIEFGTKITADQTDVYGVDAFGNMTILDATGDIVLQSETILQVGSNMDIEVQGGVCLRRRSNRLGGSGCIHPNQPCFCFS